MIKMELYKIAMKKYMWILILVFSLLFALLFFAGKGGNFNISYGKVLDDVADEINAAAYNPVIYDLITENEYQIEIEAIKPFLAPQISSAVETYRGRNYHGRDVADYLWDREVKERIVNQVIRIDKQQQIIDDLHSEPDTGINRYLIWQYTTMPQIEANLTKWDSLLDSTRFLSGVIAFFVILGAADIFSGEYSSRMHGSLLTAKKGRRQLFRNKLLASYIFAILCAVFFQLINFISHNSLYGIPFKNTPLNSLTLFYKMPTPLTALTLYTMQILGSVLGAIVLVSVVMCISSFCRSNLLSFFLSGVYFGSGFFWLNYANEGYISSVWSMPGDISTYALMSLIDVLGSGKILPYPILFCRQYIQQ